MSTPRNNPVAGSEDDLLPPPAKKVRSKADEIKRCFGFDDSSCSDDEYLSYNSAGGAAATTNTNVSCNSTLAGISPVHRIQSSFLQNNR